PAASTTAGPTVFPSVPVVQGKPLDSAKAGPAAATSVERFSNGIFQVGPDVRPGTYRTRGGGDGCYFARLKGFSGSLEDVLANDSAVGPAVVTILPTDRGFQSDNCSTWTTDLSPIAGQGPFGPGAYI